MKEIYNSAEAFLVDFADEFEFSKVNFYKDAFYKFYNRLAMEDGDGDSKINEICVVNLTGCVSEDNDKVDSVIVSLKRKSELNFEARAGRIVVDLETPIKGEEKAMEISNAMRTAFREATRKVQDYNEYIEILKPYVFKYALPLWDTYEEQSYIKDYPYESAYNREHIHLDIDKAFFFSCLLGKNGALKKLLHEIDLDEASYDGHTLEKRLFDESYGQIWVNDCCDKWIKGFLQLAFTVDTKGVYTLDMMLDELLDDSMDVKNGISKEDVDFVVHKFNEKIRFTDKLIDEFLFSASQEHKREY